MFVQRGAYPWNVPVEVETGRFVSVLPEHQELGVQVAPSPPYGCRDPLVPDDRLLFADLQTNLYSHVTGRLGSGRAGFFRGWYVKGVGRTPLAGNWNRADHLHSSGHLAASSAIREYVATLYLRSRGCASSVVACEGVLLADLDPALRDYDRTVYGPTAKHTPPVDRHLQALTVKRGNFARQSNFLWLLQHLSPGYLDRGRSSVHVFCDLLTAALTPPDAAEPAAADTTAETLASLLMGSVTRAAEHFRQWFLHGVWWGSFSNNLTIDGRFLDLETPALVGGAWLGNLSTSDDPGAAEHGRQSSLIGTELFIFLAQTRAFCNFARLALSNLPRWFRAPEREFASELASEIERQVLAPDQLLGSRDRALDWARGMLQDAFGRLPAEDHAAIDAVVAAVYDRELGSESAAGPESEPVWPRCVAVAEYPWLLTEPALRWRPFAMTTGSGRLLGPSDEACRTGRRLADLIRDLDQTTSLGALLDKLAGLAGRDTIV